MFLQNIVYSVPLIIIIIFSLVTLSYIYLLDIIRKKQHFKIESLIIMGSMIWILGNLFELEFLKIQNKIQWGNLQYVGLIIISISWIIFAIDYAGLKKWLVRRNIILLSIVPVIILILVYTNGFHHFVIKDYSLGSHLNSVVLEKAFNTGHWIILLYLLISILVGSILIGQMLIKSNHAYRWQATLFILALIIPVSVIMLFLSGANPFPHLEIIPISISLSSMLISIILSRSRIGEIVPVARENVVDSINDGVIVLDDKNNILDMNKTFQKIFNRNITEVIGRPLKIISENLNKKVESLIKEDIVNDEYFLSTNGKKHAYDISISDIFNWQDIHVGKTVLLHDITEKKEKEKVIKYLSFHDKLTGLYNRAYFELELKRLDTKRQLPVSIIMGDVNGLKLINDAFGYSEGDKLLVKSAELIKDSCRYEDIVSRWGGDEFIILLPNTSNVLTEKIVNRIISSSKKINPLKIPISISFGYSTKEDISQSISKVIKDAEERMQRRKMLESKSIYGSLISSLKRTLWEKSHETEEHTERIKDLAIKLGKSIRLPSNKLDELELLATLHDIGKIAIPDAILQGKKDLNNKEWEIMKKHTEVGYHIATSCPQLVTVADDILLHHEWWDGTGYPYNLKREEIPVTARIINIVDAYDVMRNGRPYKEGIGKPETIQELKELSGIQFDPDLVSKFIKILGKK